MITSNPFTTDNYMKAVDELKAVIEKQADEIERLREALKEIEERTIDKIVVKLARAALKGDE